MRGKWFSRCMCQSRSIVTRNGNFKYLNISARCSREMKNNVVETNIRVPLYLLNYVIGIPRFRNTSPCLESNSVGKIVFLSREHARFKYIHFVFGTVYNNVIVRVCLGNIETKREKERWVILCNFAMEFSLSFLSWIF